MKKLALLLLGVLAISTQVHAEVLDAPHNQSNHISCRNCHTYSLWWEFSPAAKNSLPDFGTAVNRVCSQCHDSESEFMVHSSFNIDSTNTYHGTDGWQIRCTECHNPHQQEQLIWALPTEPLADTFLIEGTIDSGNITYGSWTDPDTGQEYETTILSAISLTKENLSWPEETWADKSPMTPNRGLILVHDKSEVANTFPVLSAAAGQITIKGTLLAADTIPGTPDPQTGEQVPPATANSFGLIYGQLIRKTIIVPEKDPNDPQYQKSVQFFDPKNGGYIDDVEFDGICQVCHTLTTAYRNDDTATGTTHNFRSQNCSECHIHNTGFKGNGHEVHHFGWAPINYIKMNGDTVSVDCSICHKDPDNRGIVEAIHSDKCELCHIDPDGGGELLIAGDSDPAKRVDVTNGVDGDPNGEYNFPNHLFSATCADCHDKSASGPASKANINSLPDIHHLATTNNYAINEECTQCHKADGDTSANKKAADHSLAIGLTVDQGSYPDITVNGCEPCHMIDNSTEPPTDYRTHGTQTGAIVDSDLQNFNNPRVHDKCTSCHHANPAIAPIGSLINADDMLNVYGGQPDRMIPGYAPGPSGTPDTNTAIDCFSCHGSDPGIVHLGQSHDLMVGNTAQCNWCHSGQVGLPNGAAIDPLNDMVHDGCTTCHIISKGIAGDYKIGIVDPADRNPNLVDFMETPSHKELIDPPSLGQVNCVDCHGPHQFESHLAADHRAHVASNIETSPFTANCVGCHDSTAGLPSPGLGVPVNPLDNKIHDACQSCHALATGALRDSASINAAWPQISAGIVIDPLPGNASVFDPILEIQVNATRDDGGGVCADCHGINYFNKHDHGSDNDGGISKHYVSMATDTASGFACNTCHGPGNKTAEPAFVDNWSGINDIADLHSGGCGQCHNSTRNTDLSGTYTDIQDIIFQGGSSNPITCLDCHASKAVAHGLHYENDGTFTWAGMSLCQNCHGLASTNANAPKGEIIAGIHSSGIPDTNGDCALCHLDGKNGAALINSATNATRGVKPHPCTECHLGYFDSHKHGTTGGSVNHDSTITVKADPQPTANCSGCHDAVIGGSAPDAVSAPFVAGSTEVHNPQGCTTCHAADTGNLKGSASGKTTGGDCSTCHSTYFDSHIHGTSDFHYISAVSNLSGTQPCIDCHAGQLENWANILANHDISNGGCTTCHDSTRNNTNSPGTVNPAYGSLAEAINSAGQSNPLTCLDCHAEKALSHVPDHTNFVSAETGCTSCHPNTDLLTGLHPYGGNSANGCSTCHTMPYTLPLLGSASGHSRTLGQASSSAPNTCTVCHGSFTLHPVTTHGAALTATTDQSCDTCHNASAAPFNTANEAHYNNGNSCDLCHGVNGKLQGSASSHILGAVETCNSCHYADFAAHPVTTHAAKVQDSGTCASCHHQATDSPFVDAGDVHATVTCDNCHNAKGKLIGSASNHVIGEVETCNTCHYATFADHPATTHAAKVTNSGTCSACHHTAETSPFTADGEVHATGTCDNCHDAASGKLLGSASSHIFGVQESCNTCHYATFDDHAVSTHTDTITATTDLSCETCHNASTAPFNGSGEVHYNSGNSCVLCHGPNGKLQGSASKHVIGAVETCKSCHYSSFSLHPVTTHSSNLLAPADGQCVSCHIAGDSPFNAPGEVHETSSCNGCHTLGGKLQGSASSHAIGTPSDCIDCHGTNHTVNTHPSMVLSTEDKTCDACHVTGTSPFTANNDVHSRLGCVFCHHSITGKLLGSASAHVLGTASYCDDCHSSGWQAIHSAKANETHATDLVTKDNGCMSCHNDANLNAPSANTSPFTGDSEVHNANSCSTCHDINGKRLPGYGSASGMTSGGGNCSACHTEYFDAHTHGVTGGAANHDSSITVQFNSIETENCGGCHDAVPGGDAPDAIAPPFTANSTEVHFVLGCLTCHDTVNGVLKGSASGKSGGDCGTCHISYFNQHQYGSSSAHNVKFNLISSYSDFSYIDTTAFLAQDTSAPGAKCDFCHTVSTWEEITELHNVATNGEGPCATCHNATRNVSRNGTVPNAPAETISDVRLRGDLQEINCVDCHWDNQVLHVPDHTNFVAADPDCTKNCHTDESLLLGIHPSSGTKSNGCRTCHLGTVTPVTLVGSASGHYDATLAEPNYCSTCHYGNFSNHPVSTHDLTLQAANACLDCHAATEAPFVTATEVHYNNGNSCDLCHTAKGPMIGSASNHIIGQVENCNTCHYASFDDHPISTHADTITATTDLSCETCHNAGIAPFNSADEVHYNNGNSCDLCHGVNGKLQGSASNHVIGAVESCKTCHYANFAAHPATTHAAKVQDSGTCASCHHQAADSPFVDGTEVHAAAGCANCHDAKGKLIGSASNHVIGVAETCNTCHYANFAAHPVTTHTAKVTNSGTCSECHHAADVSPFTADGEVHANGTCDNCHDASTGKMLGSASSHTFGTQESCNTCHYATFNDHAVSTHAATITATTDQSCETCHNAGTAPFNGSGEVHYNNGNSCDLCHGVNGKLQGSASKHVIGAVESCKTCHYATFAAHPATTHAAKVQDSGTCASCHHQAADSPFVDGTEVHAAAGCANCHDAKGKLIGSASSHVIGVADNCNTCHYANFAAHPITTHAAKVTNSGTCSECHHTADVSPFTADGEVHANGTCDNCHDAATGKMLGSASSHTFGVQESCNTCHYATFNDHAVSTHAATITATTDQSCETCHNAGIAPFNGSGEVHYNNGNSCDLCHGVNGKLQGSASKHVIGAVESCKTCHYANFAAHPATTHAAKVQDSGTCASCHHQATDSPFVDGTEVHAAAGCANCHDAKGKLIGSASSHVIGEADNCNTCHYANFAAHPVTTHAAKVTNSGTCSECHHTADVSPFTADGEVHANGTCDNCHDAATGKMLGSASSHTFGTQESCNTCHYATFNDHAVSTHAATITATTDQSCETCHNAGTAPFNSADEVHYNNGNSCDLCHGVNGKLQGSASKHVIGEVESCKTCHYANFAAHPATTHADMVQDSGTCASCHHQAADSPFVDGTDVHAAAGCANCHDAKGKLIGSASSHVIGVAETCNTCHYANFAAHPVTTHTAKVTNSGTCSECHHAADVSPFTADGEVHANGTCDNCHDAATGKMLGSASSHTFGVQESCNTCHYATFNDHAVSTHAATITATTDQSCETCHNAGIAPFNGADEVHYNNGNSCDLCHGVNGKLQGSASKHVIGAVESCKTCHYATFAAHPATTHADMVQDSGTCASCHHQATDSPFVDGTEVHAAAGCANCHDAKGKLIGSASSHVIGVADNCNNCHYANFAAHPITTHAAKVTNSGTCSECHHTADVSPFTADGEVHANGTCDNCHDAATGKMLGSASNHTFGVQESCNTCHYATFNDHAVSTHAATITATTDQSCETCHNAGTAPFNGADEVHYNNGNSCDLCHGVNGKLQGSASKHVIGAVESCKTCHYANFAAHPATTHAAKVQDSGSCASCHHQAADSPFVDGSEVHAAAGCANCHDAKGKLIGSASSHVIGVAETCNTCHYADFAAHPVTTHAAKVTNSGTCSECHHTADVSPFTADGEVHANGTCDNCHDAATGKMLGSASSHTFGVQESCNTCHYATFNDHAVSTHAATITATTDFSCETCHNAGIAPFNGSDEVHYNNGNSCDLCHGVNGKLQGSASKHVIGAVETCKTCHYATFAAHPATTHADMVQDSGTCASCHHQATGSPFVDGTEVHAAAGCANCHNAKGKLIGSASSHVIGVADNCNTCHYANFAAHPVTTHAAKVTNSGTCSECHHTADVSPFTADGEVHANGTCDNCHDAATGKMLGSASSHTFGVQESCNTCHYATFNDHAVSTHAATITATTDQSCETCHNAATAPFNGADEVHYNNGNSCDLCHGVNGKLQGSASKHVIGAVESCKTCHYATFAAHPATTHADMVQDSGTCASCHHQAADSPFVDGTEVHAAAGCANCHNAKGKLIGSASSHVIGVAETCNTCHYANFAAHPITTHAAKVTNSGTCSECHHTADVSPFTADGEVHANGTCDNCHDAVTGKMLGSASNHTFGVQESCNTCHYATFNDHAVSTHAATITATTDQSCETCHNAGIAPFNGADEVHYNNGNSCDLCHGVNGKLQGSASKHVIGAVETCKTCHYANFAAHPATTHAAKVQDSGTCASCHHQATDSPFVDGSEVHAAAGCANCHDAKGKLIGSASSHVIGVAETCNTCHYANFAAHPVTTHAAKVTNSGTCSECHHTADVSPFTADGEVHANGTCDNCHDAETGKMLGSASSHTFGTQESCNTCHYATFNDHAVSTHAATITATTDQSCETCHNAGIAPFNGSGEVHYNNGNSCDLCHGVNGKLQGSASNHVIGAVESCKTCHYATFAAHPATTHAAKVQDSGTCASCHHQATDSPFVDGTDVHAAASCANCHDAKGKLIGSASSHVIGVAETCNTCHYANFAAHPITTHTNMVIATNDNSCDFCHTSGISPFVENTNNPHYNDGNGCTLCHASDGKLQGSASTHVIGVASYCNNCHNAAWQSLHQATGQTLHDASLVTADTNCTTCHNDANPNAPSATDSPYTLNSQVHSSSSCATCHDDSGKLLDAYGNAPGLTGAGGNCSTCHTDYFAGHTHTHTGVTSTPSCVFCHDNGSLNISAPDAISSPYIGSGEVHQAAGCNTCHATNGTFLAGTNSGAGGECVDCHGQYMADHQVVAHDNRSVFFGTGTYCEGCHTNNSPVLGTAGTGTLISQSDINDLHGKRTGNSCELCHNYDYDNQKNAEGLPTLDTVNTAIINGMEGSANASCIVCHDYNQTNHGQFNHEISAVAANEACMSCHDVNGTADHIADIHNIGPGAGQNSCSLCHIHPYGGGPLVDSYGTAPTMNQSGGDCSSCHNGDFPSYFAGHHPKTYDHNGQLNMTPSCIVSGCHDTFIIPDLVASGHGCNSCHTPGTGVLQGSASDRAGLAPSNCIDCHGNSWESLHTSFSEVIHSDSLVTINNNCSTCHDALPGGSAPDAISSPYIDNGQVHNSTGQCATCHYTDGALKAGYGSASGMTTAGGDCDTCHNTYFAKHSLAHSSVNPITPCSECHDDGTGSSSARTALNTPFIGNGEVHDNLECATCHNNDGTFKSLTNNGNGGTCISCHGDYFNSHLYGTNSSHYVSDTGNLSGPSPCIACHQGEVESWTNILTKHDILANGGCVTCHDSIRSNTNNPGTVNPLYDSIAQVINLGGQDYPITCLDCHADRSQVHGGHQATDFGWSGNCDNCHSGEIIPSVHGNECTICHLSTDFSQRITGSTSNGIDGSAVGASLASTCTNCHDMTPLGEIHHISKNNYAETGECTLCHNTGNGHAASHSGSVAVVTPCDNCHTATAGGVDNVPVDATPGTKLHDACTDCHEVSGTSVILRIGSSAEGHIGGGNCTTCHFADFNSHSHTHAMVNSTSSCVLCHDDGTLSVSAPDAISSPFIGSGEVHEGNGCNTCHESGGTFLAGTNSGLGGECVDCHGQYMAEHQVVSHDNRSVLFGTGTYCVACHTNDSPVLGTAGTGTLVSQSDINELHGKRTGNSCEICHNYDYDNLKNAEGLPTSESINTAVIDGMEGNTNASCVVCHDYNQTNHGQFDHEINAVTGTDACLSCHDVNGTADFITDIHNIGSNAGQNNCGLCHMHPYGGGPLVGAANTAPDMTQSGGECSSCHNGFFPSYFMGHHPNAYNHNNQVDITPSCIVSGCHDTYITPDLTASGHGCSSCHTLGTGVFQGSAAGRAGLSPSNCVDCHGTRPPTHGQP